MKTRAKEGKRGSVIERYPFTDTLESIEVSKIAPFSETFLDPRVRCMQGGGDEERVKLTIPPSEETVVSHEYAAAMVLATVMTA